MKRIIFVLFCLATACGSGVSEEIVIKSKNGGVISISGKKASIASPFMVNMKVDYQQWHDSLQFESYSSELTEKTVQFQWETEEFCQIKFAQRDGDTLRFNLTMQPGKLMVEKVKK